MNKFNFEKYVKPEKLLTRKALQQDAGSWVVVHKESGEAVLETFSIRTAQAINLEKYDVIPILEYLYALNAKIKSMEQSNDK